MIAPTCMAQDAPEGEGWASHPLWTMGTFHWVGLGGVLANLDHTDNTTSHIFGTFFGTNFFFLKDFKGWHTLN